MGYYEIEAGTELHVFGRDGFPKPHKARDRILAEIAPGHVPGKADLTAYVVDDPVSRANRNTHAHAGIGNDYVERGWLILNRRNASGAIFSAAVRLADTQYID